ncbi:hypothetical protein SODALDRAFT_341121 [Sodiomyces alkalinus F11]|uniref:Methyltransferase type 11 domain-containing protein n=1 Tax=Sodiomyces alkalinus (strain CBS 110278 / VKM F-3762 / F11) TaxID=1314773 RepID=A0A3N2PR64_SODAK|nr:hypothetical protein SODALDRAFT_341121 [Sodiomyces alkalinus F11]ROT37001.1 hypothetical protein SODALDRAFT_341121 [Sodiomyces alkalinus F11]
MAELVLLPSSTYRPPSPPLARRPGKLLNTIIEEESEEESGIRHRHGIQQQQQQQQLSNTAGGRNGQKLRPRTDMHIEAWLSPMSDHFPTPRGFHYLAAPILPSSPSTGSTDGPPSPSQTSNQWNYRSSVMTDVTEFDDLYGLSDEEEPLGPLGPLGRTPSRKSSHKRKGATGAVTPASHARGNLPQLVIPNTRNGPTEEWSATSARSAGLKKLTSPIPPTPPTRVEMSPQVFSFMQARQAQEVPTLSAPPSLDGSLDGSLSSEQMAQMSAPPTPVIGNDDNVQEDGWSGVQLQPGALATLQALSGESDSGSMTAHEQEGPEQVLEVEVPSEPIPEMRQQPLRIFTGLHFQAPRTAELTPASQHRSLADLTRLEIPSPGGFFLGLSPRTRSTWHMLSKSPEELAPPTSTTAEQFYRCPWNAETSAPPVPRIPSALALPTRLAANDNMAEQFYRGVAASSSPVEQVVEVKDEDDIEDDMPTARPPQVPSTASASDSFTVAVEPVSPEVEVEEEAPTEIVTVYDPDYARKQQEVALSNLDRTEMWLMAQRSYLKPVEIEEKEGSHQGLPAIPEDTEEEEEEEERESKTSGTELEVPMLPRKKTVRFSSIVTTTRAPCRLPSKLLRQESAYYRAFQDYIIRKGSLDVFVHRLPRFEALQAQRISLPEYHRNQLMGKYQLSVVPQSAKKRLSANVARGDDILLDDPEKLRQEKEQEAMSQIAMSTWHVAANKMLNGGRLISSPVAKRLAHASRMAPGKNGVARDRARILDLGGQSTCDWGWHCALQFPNTKIYTVTTKAIRQLSNSNIRGPPNHRQVAVERLTRLPFADAQFDLISARELHSILKFVGENGEDEWESCLRECMRVLKPGGYLEFSLLDSDIVNAGPLGLAKSVELGFTLKTLGYDPCPTKMWLGRLARAGFDEVRRAWMYLPMGERRPASSPTTTSGAAKPLPALPRGLPTPPPSDGEGPRTVTLEAMVTGSSDATTTGSSDAAASITGLAASWVWERWLLRCEMEKLAGELRLTDIVTTGRAMTEAGKCLDGVAAIVEEGRTCGAGWRVLNGYARKPKVGSGVIPVHMDA